MNLVDIWLRQLANTTVQGSLAMAVALLLTSTLQMAPARFRVWILRVALLKTILAFFWIGGVAIMQAPLESSRTLGGPFFQIAAIAACSLWAFCVATGLVRHAISLRDVGLLLTRCRVVDESETGGVLKSVLGSTKIRLMATGSRFSPFLVWYRGFVVVVPEELLLETERDRLRIALAHEVSHYLNHDLAWSLLKSIADLLFFFNPLVGLVNRRLRLCEEFAADARAIEMVRCSPGTYSRTLLTFASTTPLPGNSFALAEAASELDGRIKETFRRGLSKPSWRVVAAGSCIAAGLVLLIPLTLSQPEPQAYSPRTGVTIPVAK